MEEAVVEEVIRYIAERLVDTPEAVKVRRVEQGRQIVYELSVHPDETGKVIGKQGRIANALRQIVKAGAMKTRDKATVEIVAEQ